MVQIRKCEAPFHPFKTKTFNHRGWDNEFEVLCPSCRHFLSTQKMMLEVILLKPTETLYGNKYIFLSKKDALELVKQIYKESE